MRRLTIVLFWWFLLLGEHPVVVGPFLTDPQCEGIKTETVALTIGDEPYRFTACWNDEQVPILRK
jgi:hypothetical protein